MSESENSIRAMMSVLGAESPYRVEILRREFDDLLSEHAAALKYANERWRQTSKEVSTWMERARVAEAERDEADRQRVEADEKAWGASENHLKALELVARIRSETLKETTKALAAMADDARRAGGEEQAETLDMAHDAMWRLPTTPPPTPEREMVREAHRKFRAYMADVPGVPPDEVLAGRQRLADGERSERLEAVSARDLARMCHERTDEVYVALGDFVAWGVDFAPIFRIVAECNMTRDVPAEAGGRWRKGATYVQPLPLIEAELERQGWQKPDVAKVLRAEGWQPPFAGCACPTTNHLRNCDLEEP